MVYLMDIFIWPAIALAVGYLGGLTGIRREFTWKSLIIALIVGLGGVIMGLILHFMTPNVVFLFGIPIGGADWLFLGLTFNWTMIQAWYGPWGAWWIWFLIVNIVYVIPSVPGFWVGKKLYLSLEKQGYT